MLRWHLHNQERFESSELNPTIGEALKHFGNEVTLALLSKFTVRFALFFANRTAHLVKGWAEDGDVSKMQNADF